MCEDQKILNMKWCRELLKIFDKVQSRNVSKNVAGDDTYLYYYDMPTKVWVCKVEDTSVAVRIMISIFKIE